MNGEDTKALYAKLDQLSTDLAALRATVEVSNRQQREELKALFAYRNTHEERIGIIERDYVPRRTHEQHVRRHEEVERRVTRLETKVAVAIAIGGLVGGVAGGLLQLVLGAWLRGVWG